MGKQILITNIKTVCNSLIHATQETDAKSATTTNITFNLENHEKVSLVTFIDITSET